MAAFDAPGLRLFVITTAANEPELLNDESIIHRFCNIELSFDKENSTKNMGLGTIFVTQSRIIFIGAKHSFDFDVRYIVLHAVSRDKESYPKPCLYCQFAHDEEQFYDDCEENGEDIDEECMKEELANEEDIQTIATSAVEMFLVPSNDTDLLQLFNAFSNAALSNPDPVEPGHEFDDEDDGLIYNIEEVELGAMQARALDHLESIFVEPPGIDMEE